MKKYVQIWCIGMLAILLQGCIREVPLEFEDFDSFLIVDATLTNELKPQQIILSRYEQGEGSPLAEEGATVVVFEDGTAYDFVELENGVYQSSTSFEIQQNRSYYLEITTRNGKRYRSSTETLPATAELKSLYAEREVNDDGIEGVGMYVDGESTSTEAMFYRFDFEETFVVAPPYFTNDDVTLISGYPQCAVWVLNNSRSESKRICYRTQYAEGLNLLELNNVSQSIIDRQLVRFISQQRYEISYRYSIKANQYILSEGAFRYYEKLDSFSTEDNVFSQVQPGFVISNITAVEDANELVVGYFDLSTITSKRIFFNYEDFFPGEPLPPFVDECILQAQLQFPTNSAPRCGPLITVIESGSYLFVRPNNGEISPGGPYIMAPRICGDCTVLGQPEPPDFWID